MFPIATKKHDQNWQPQRDPWQVAILGAALAGGILLFGLILVPMIGDQWRPEAFVEENEEWVFDGMLVICVAIYAAWVALNRRRQIKETACIEHSHREHQRRLRLRRLTRRLAPPLEGGDDH